MDKIHIYNLEIFAHHGVFPEENALGQRFLISAVLYADLREAGRTDELQKSIHYGEVCQQMKRYMESHTEKLIEKAAEGLAEELLMTWPLLRRIKLELKKPWAPIGLPLETVSVEIDRQWHRAYIALGSNLGDKKKYLDQAVKALGERKGCLVKKVSDYLSTEPYGVTDQPEFLNACLELETLYTPEELLACLHQIEQEADRVRTVRWGPRTLDLDIIFYDELVMGTDDLCIPHVDLQNRDFVLKPLAGIAPYMHHPVYGKTVKELLAELESREEADQGSDNI